MLNDPAFWGAIVVAVAVVVTGTKIMTHIDNMNINLGNGVHGSREILHEKLTSIEDKLHDIEVSTAYLADRIDRIEQSVRPEEDRPLPF